MAAWPMKLPTEVLVQGSRGKWGKERGENKVGLPGGAKGTWTCGGWLSPKHGARHLRCYELR
jgi:hypothetical protein